MASNTNPSSGKFVAAAKLVSALTLLSRVTGLLREMVMAANFGRGPVVAAFVFAFQLPNLFRRLFGEGALSAALIPIYTETLKKDPALARRLASLCIALLLLVLGSLTLLGEAALAALLTLHDWTPDTVLAIRLMMVMLPYMPMVCLVAIVGSMLQVHGRFAPAAGAPVLLNVVMIAAILFATHGAADEESLRQRVYVIALSVLAAGVLQLAWTVGSMLRVDSFTRVFTGTREPMKALMKVFLPMVMGLAVFQINTFLDGLIAWGLAPREGRREMLHLLGMTLHYPLETSAIADLAWAQRLYEFPLGIFGIAIATAIFPALAHAAAEVPEKGVDHFRTILHHGLRMTVFIGLPASVGLLLVRVPLVRIAYERGQFNTDDSLHVAAILVGYAPAIWAYSMNHVITRAFYAFKDSKGPLRISLAMVGLNLALNLTLVWPLGAAGLAWATAICAMLQNVLLLRAIRSHVDHPVDRTVWVAWGRVALLTLLMAIPLQVMLWGFDPASLSRTHSAMLLGVMLVTGAAIVLGGAWVMKLDELKWLLGRRAE